MQDLVQVEEGKPSVEPAPLLALNIGTGLGAAIAIPAGEGWAAQATEAGHMRLGAAGPQELEMFEGLQTFEELLAGPGWQRFQREHNHLSSAVMAGLYSRVLGRFAGDLVLATGTWGGVYFCGGVMKSWDNLVDPGVLLENFADHGPMAGLLQTVPLYRIVSEDPALQGLASAGLSDTG
jgi:glucokinase